MNGNYLDCNGNIDNDMGHHVTTTTDTDPGHHIGMNCPVGSPLMSQNNWMNTGSAFMLNWPSNSGEMPQWVIIPLTNETINKLYAMPK